MADPFNAANVLLLGFEGASGATSISDESITNNKGTATVVGNGAYLSTTFKKAGVSSLVLNGTDDYLTFPPSVDWQFGTGDFCVEGWFRFWRVTTNNLLIGAWPNNFAFYFEAGQLFFRGYDGANRDSAKHTLSARFGEWYHLAVDRHGTDLRIFVNGVMVTKTTGYNYDLNQGASSVLAIGSLRPAAFANYDTSAWIDEIRITKGVSRYGADTSFTPANQLDRGATTDGAVRATKATVNAIHGEAEPVRATKVAAHVVHTVADPVRVTKVSAHVIRSVSETAPASNARRRPLFIAG